MQDINLLQNKLKDDSNKTQRQASLLTVVFSLILAAELAAAGVFYYLDSSAKTKTAELGQKNAQLQRQLDEMEANLVDAKAFQGQTQNIKQLLSAHIYWSGVFNALADSTFTGTSYKIVSGDTLGKIHLEGRVVDYLSLSKSILALKTSEHFSDVILMSTNPSEDQQAGILYSLDLILKPEIFKEQ